MIVMMWAFLSSRNINLPLDLFYTLFSSFIQGNLALVAFLGAVAIFQLQNHQSEFSKLCYRFNPQDSLLIFYSHQKVVDGFPEISSEDYSEKMAYELDGLVDINNPPSKKEILKRMSELHRFEWEIRDRATGLSFMTFIDVAVIMFFLITIDSLSQDLRLWVISTTFVLAMIVLFDSAHLIRRIVGYSYQKSY